MREIQQIQRDKWSAGVVRWFESWAGHSIVLVFGTIGVARYRRG
jgi:hypothetical protein